jgi:hypothetical protein
MVSAWACFVGPHRFSVTSSPAPGPRLATPRIRRPGTPRVACTLGSRSLVAPLRTSHPSGSRLSAPCGAWPLAALAAPENPLFPTVSNPRGRSSRPHRSVASHGCDPTPCGSRCGRNELRCLGGIGTRRAISFHGFCQPPSDTAAAVPLIARLLIRRPSIPRRACRPS